MKKSKYLYIILLVAILTSCSFFQSEFAKTVYEYGKDYFYNEDSTQVFLKEKEIFFYLNEGQELDSLLADSTSIWVDYDKADKSYTISIQIPSRVIKVNCEKK